MKSFARGIVNRQVLSLAQYLLDRLLGPYLERKLDLKQEGTQLGVNTIVINDIALRCDVLNEKMTNSPLQFLRFRIGQLKINISYSAVAVAVSVNDIQIDLIAFESSGPKQKQAAPTKPQAGNGSNEEYLVDRLFFSKMLQNLELSITDVAVRLVLSDKPVFNYQRPTLLFRLKAMCLTKKDHSDQKDTKMRINDMQKLLSNKQLAFSDISVHLMKDQYLSLSEDILAMQKDGRFFASLPAESSFPHEYPFLNHPSTIFLLKSTLPPVSNFHPSALIDFDQASGLECKIPIIEAIMSVEQIKVLFKCMDLIPPAPRDPRNEKEKKSDTDLMHSVLDFDIMNRAGIGGVDVDREIDEEDIQTDLKAILKTQKDKEAANSRVSKVKASVDIGLVSFTLICHEESEVENDRIFKAMELKEFVPVGRLKCPWYEFTLSQIQSNLSIETIMMQESVAAEASIGLIRLKRFDFEERKAKVQLGGNFKQPAVRRASQDDSDNTSNYKSCLSQALETSNYQMANESLEYSDMFFDAERSLTRMNSAPQSNQKQAAEIKNVFRFQQLTNVLRFTEIDQSVHAKAETELHLCSKTVFEVVQLHGEEAGIKLSFKTTKVHLNSNSDSEVETDLKSVIRCGKIFINIGPQDIILAIKLDVLFAKAPVPPEEQIFIPNLTYLDHSNLSQDQPFCRTDLTVTLEAAEVTIANHLLLSDAASLISKFNDKNPTQDLMHTAGCSCPPSDKKAETSSMTIVLGQVNLKQTSEMIVQLASAELIGSNGKTSVSLMTIEKVQVSQGAGQKQTRAVRQVTLDQIVEEMKSEETKGSDVSYLEPQFQPTTSSELVASKSSSLEQALDHSSLNLNGIFNIEQSATRPLIEVKRVLIKLDQAEMKPLLKVVSLQEMFLKTIMNLADIATVKKCEQTVQDRQKYFDTRRKRKLPPLSVHLQVEDVYFQIYTAGKQRSDEILKLRMNAVHISLRLQDRGLLTNIRVALRIKDLMVIDKAQNVCRNYTTAKFSKEEEPRLAHDSYCLTFRDELEQYSQFLLIHPAYVRSQQRVDGSNVPRHEKKVVKALIDVAFVNRSFMEERTSTVFLDQKLSLLKSKRPATLIVQLAQDFADLKTNPLQLKAQCSIQNLVTTLSNQNMNLSQKLSQIAQDAQTILSKVRTPNLRDVSPDPACAMPQEYNLFEKQRVELDIQDFTVTYTPVLSRLQAESILLMNHQPGEDHKVRMPYEVALHVNQIKLITSRSVPPTEPQSYRPKAKHSVDSPSIVFYFLHKTATTMWPYDLLQGMSLLMSMKTNLPGYKINHDSNQTQTLLQETYTTVAQELGQRGFVPIASVLETRISKRSNSFSFQIGSLTISLAGDSLRHFMDFCKLVQLTMADELKQLEQLEEEMSDLTQSDQLAASAYQRFEHQQQLKMSIQSHQVRADSSRLVQQQLLCQSQAVPSGEVFSCNPKDAYFSKEAAGTQQEIETVLAASQIQSLADADFFIVDGDAPHGSVATQPRRSKNPFSKSVSPPSNQTVTQPQQLNIASMIDPDYFVPLQGIKVEEQRFRRIHQREFEPETKEKFCSFELTFELGSATVQIHAGSDFDFDLRPSQFKTFDGLTSKENLISSQVVLQQIPIQKSPFVVEDDYFSTPVNSQQQKREQLINDVIQAVSQKRLTTRRSHEFIRVQLQDLLLSRRQYPDKEFMTFLTKAKESSEVPKVGKKLKTLAISLRTLQISHTLKGTKLTSLFNHPYHFRFHNFFEFKDYSERSYRENVDEHQIQVFLRPTHLTISQEPIDFLTQIIPSPSQQQLLQDEQDFELLDATITMARPVSEDVRHVVKHFLIKESSLTVSVAGLFSKFIQVRDLTIKLKEFKLNCIGIAKDIPEGHFYSDVLDESIQLVTGKDDVHSMPFDETINRLVFFYRNDIVANQKLAILSGFRPIQALKYAGGSFISPVYKPLYRAYHLGYLGFLFGLGEGVQDFYGMLQTGSRSVALIAVKNISKL